MRFFSRTRRLRSARVAAGILLVLIGGAVAQTVAPDVPLGAPPVVAPKPADPVGQDPVGSVAPPALPDPNRPSADASGGVEVQLSPRPVLRAKGAANWDDGFAKLTTSFRALAAEAERLKLAVDGRPMAYFIETDDVSFRYEALLPLAEAPSGPDKPGSGFEIAQSPGGRAMKFPHEGAYDDIDSAYEAITAYLDEKGLTAKGQFIEEYLNEPAASDDASMKLNIFVFVD